MIEVSNKEGRYSFLKKEPLFGDRVEYLWASLVFFLALPLLIMRMYYPGEWGDEGYFANGALRVLSGEVIYRDFQHNYPPGRVYTLALLTALFKHDITVIRSFWVFLHAASAAMSFLVARRLMALPFAFLVSLVILFNPVHLNKATELLLTSLVLLILFRVLERKTSDLAAGVWLGFAGLYRHDVAIFGTIVYVVVLAIQAREENGSKFLSRFRRRLNPAKKYMLGFALVWGPVSAYLLFHGALWSAVKDLAVSGFIANAILSLPFPALIEELSLRGVWEGVCSTAVVYCIPVLVYAAGLVVALVSLVKRRDARTGAFLLVVTLLGSALYLQVLPRTDLPHLNKAYVPAHILGIFLVAAAFGKLRASVKGKKTVWTLAWGILCLLCVAMPLKHLERTNSEARFSIYNIVRKRDKFVRLDLPRGWITVNAMEADYYRRMFSVIEPYAGAEDEWMVVFPAGALFNYLFDIKNPLPYDLLRPGELAGTGRSEQTGLSILKMEPNHPRILQGIVDRIEETKPRFLLENAERTNDPICRLLKSFRGRHGYRAIPARTVITNREKPRLVLYVRKDS